MGSHCEETSCKQLDYLPMKCDACSRLFCKDHLLYDDHTCSGKYKKDIQVKISCASLATIRLSDLSQPISGASLSALLCPDSHSKRCSS